MSVWFADDWLLLTLLLLAAFIAMLGVLRNARVSRGVLIALQLPCALLLLSALLLRDTPVSGSMIVLTAAASRSDITQMARASQQESTDALRPLIIALGSVESDIDGIERAPDLATALRRYPGITHVHVLGHGLEAHDRAALGSRELSFTLPVTRDAPAALVEWDLPTHVNVGAVWQLRGRVAGAVSLIELRDPADALEASTTPDANGRFELRGTARAVGPMLYSLRLRLAKSEDESAVQTLPVPINPKAATPMRALLLAAVPSPELKYLRRWASDAGVELDSRIILAPGLVQARTPTAIDAAMLAKLDLAIVDERSWPQVARQSAALREAVGDGLGVLIRITGPVPAAVQADWRALGLAFELSANAPRAVRLDDGGPVVAGERLHAWPITPGGSEYVRLLGDTKARPLAIRAALGAGRVGVIAVADSFRLVTRGEHARYATLWSTLFADVARARAEPAITVPEMTVVGQRAVICGDGEDVQVQMPDDTRQPLLRDPAAADCAAFWPTVAGWHRLIADSATPSSTETAANLATRADADADTQSQGTAFYVFDPTAIGSVLTQQTGRATAELANRELPPASVQTDREHWRRALCLAWLLVMVAIWWVERRSQQALP